MCSERHQGEGSALPGWCFWTQRDSEGTAGCPQPNCDQNARLTGRRGGWKRGREPATSEFGRAKQVRPGLLLQKSASRSRHPPGPKLCNAGRARQSTGPGGQQALDPVRRTGATRREHGGSVTEGSAGANCCCIRATPRRPDVCEPQLLRAHAGGHGRPDRAPQENYPQAL